MKEWTVRKVWTASEDRQLTRLWAREDLTKADIARALGCSSHAATYRALRPLGLSPRKRGCKTGTHMVEHPVQKWASMVKAGRSLASIAAGAGITRQRVAQVLAARGIARPPVGRRAAR